jgi:RNA polymerase sigma-70 factor (ECF subfamily)
MALNTCLGEETLKSADLDAAFTALVEQYTPRVYRQCCRLVGSDEAADATQETFLAAYTALDGFRGGPVIAWLGRIARNKCYDRLRRRHYYRVQALSCLPDAADGAAERDPPSTDPASDPESWVMHRELQQELGQVLGRLRPEERRLVLLADVADIPYAQIAAHLGVRPGTIKSRVFRVRRKLRRLLQLTPGMVNARYRSRS